MRSESGSYDKTSLLLIIWINLPLVSAGKTSNHLFDPSDVVFKALIIFDKLFIQPICVSIEKSPTF